MIPNFLSSLLIPTAFAQTSTTKAAAAPSYVDLIIQFLAEQVPRWSAAIIIIFGTLIFARLAKTLVENKMAEKGIEEEHREIAILAGRSSSAIILTLGLTTALKVAGIDLTTIIAAVAFGIGFALRDLIMNFLAGAMILISRQIAIGDFIRVNDTLGRVVEIQTRATILKAIDGTKIIVPNADLFTNQVTNLTGNPLRRIQLLVGVEYNSNLQVVIDTILQALKKTSGILLTPAPTINFFEFADSSINVKIKFWVECHSKWVKTKSNAIINIKKEFDAVGINIPFPINTLYTPQEKDAQEVHEAQLKAFSEHYVINATPHPSAITPPFPSTPTPPENKSPIQNILNHTSPPPPITTTTTPETPAVTPVAETPAPQQIPTPPAAPQPEIISAAPTPAPVIPDEPLISLEPNLTPAPEGGQV